jgi:CRP/FNR family transcriptional regulator
MTVLDELERFEPFSKLSSQGKILLAQGAIRKECARSTIALIKGQTVSGAYVVLSGRLRVFTHTPGGTEATLYFIDPGETCVLALNCLFNDLLYPAWVQAEEVTVVSLISGAVYRKLFERESTIQNLTVHALSTIVFRLMTELEQIHSSHYKQRLANFILLHASSGGILQMTQQQIASHLGTTREVIARLLQEFVAKDVVRTQRGALAILDASELQKLTASPE